MLAQLLSVSEAGRNADRDEAVPSETEPPELTLDVLFDVLQNERRRCALRHLSEQDGPVAFGDLVDHVAAAEYDGDGAPDSAARKAVYTSLYQSHLPKLDDCGVVDYDRQSGPVAQGPHLDEIIECLDAVQTTRGRDADGLAASSGLESILSSVKA